MILSDPSWCPRQRLIAAVLMQAYHDALAGGAVDHDRTTAIRFLTNQAGSLARYRNAYCGLLGLDGDVLAERVRRMLDGEIDMPPAVSAAGDNPNKRRQIMRRHENRVADARARWQYLKNPTGAPDPSVDHARGG